MAFATEPVTGNLADFGASSLTGLAPKIVFTPSGPAVDGVNGVFVSRPVEVIPGGSGAFIAPLVRTDDKHPEVWYSVAISWLDAAGNYLSWDFIDWRLYVPAGGGELAQLLRRPANPNTIWFGPEPPADPVEYTAWVDTDAVPPVYYEWEN